LNIHEVCVQARVMASGSLQHQVPGPETSRYPLGVLVDEEGAFRELPCNLQKGPIKFSSSSCGFAGISPLWPLCTIAPALCLLTLERSSPPLTDRGIQALPVLRTFLHHNIGQTISENSSGHTEPQVACVLVAILCVEFGYLVLHTP
jgi:hypothetical protein